MFRGIFSQEYVRITDSACKNTIGRGIVKTVNRYDWTEKFSYSPQLSWI